MIVTTIYVHNFRYPHGFHTFVQLNNRQNDGKNRSVISIKQLYGTATTELNDAVDELKLYVEKGNITAAIKIYETCKQRSDFHKMDFVFLTLVNGLLKSKRIDEAKQIVVEFNSNNLKSYSTKDCDAILCSIFDSSSNHLDLDDLQWFVDNLIFSRKYVNRKVFEVIIKTWKQRDLDAAIDLFIRIGHQFRMTPLNMVLTCDLINLGDTERLEKILETSSRLHGKMNSFYDMAFAFTICGRIDQAKRIFSSLETEDFRKIENFIHHLKLRGQVEHLHNLLIASENCVPKQCREKMYIALLELYAYENDSNKIMTNILSAMNEEQIIPTDENINKVIKLMKRINIEIPKSWQQTQSNEDDSEAKLQNLLNENKIPEANQIFYDSLKSETPLQRNIMRYCLLKNAENGQIAIFEDLRQAFDFQTKVELKFHTYECEAYIKAGKHSEYLKVIRDVKNGDDMKELAISFSERIIDMIELSPSIYEECKYTGIYLNVYLDK